jgi:hypothetical protein
VTTSSHTTPALTVEDWRRLFADFQHEAIHLELRDVYTIQEEQERFRHYLASGARDHAAEAAARQPWLDLVSNASRSGKRIRRARIVSEPISDYIRFEWAGTGPTVAAGEEVRWLPRSNTSSIALPGNDFWLFDENLLILNHFAGDGSLVGQEVSPDIELAALCKSAFERVWEVATPHQEYHPR